MIVFFAGFFADEKSMKFSDDERNNIKTNNKKTKHTNLRLQFSSYGSGNHKLLCVRYCISVKN